MADLITEPGMFQVASEERSNLKDDFLEEIDYSENYAKRIPKEGLDMLGQYLMETISHDESVRKSQWEAKAAEGIRRLKFTMDASSGEDMPESEGSISVRFPLVKEAMTQFQARAMEEIFPPQGPVKTKLLGRKSKDRLARAKRVAGYMNYSVTSRDPEWQKGDDKMLFMLPLLGCMFKRVAPNEKLRRIESRMVRGDHIVMPYGSTGINEAPRWAYKFFEYSSDFLTKQKDGTYLNTSIVENSGEVTLSDAERTDLQEIIDEADGQEAGASYSDMDLGYEMYEVHINLDLSSEKPWEPTSSMKPFMVFVEKSTETVLGIFADWEDITDGEKGPVYDRVQHMVQYDYLPGFGAYGFGLYHMIGDLDEAASELLVTIINAGNFASAQGGLVSQQVAPNGLDINIQPGVYQSTEIPIEDLRNAFFTPDFKPPSPVLHQALVMLVDSAKSYANTTEAMTGSAQSTGPVGTMALLVEQGSKVYSGIHKRVHNSKKIEYQILYRLIKLHLAQDGYPYPLDDGEDPGIMIEDFEEDFDVEPVSDPNISSNQQRIALQQAAYQIASDNPDFIDKRETARRLLEALRVPDYDSLFVDHIGYDRPLDPGSENAFLLIGKVVKTHPDEHHEAHIAVHMHFLNSPLFQRLPEEAKQPLYVAVQSHIMYHQAYLYLQAIEAPYVNLEDPEDDESSVFTMPLRIVNEVSISQAVKLGPSPSEQIEAPQPPPTPDQIAAQMKQKAWEEEEARKQKSWEAEEARKQQEAEAEQRRKEADHLEEIRREREKMDAQQGREVEQSVRSQLS